MAMQISIDSPCTESWDKMSEVNNGRFCGSCLHAVVDFSNWEPEAILNYLKNKTNVCGRFSADQLSNDNFDTSENNEHNKLEVYNFSSVKKVAAVVFLLFCFSYNNNSSYANVPLIASNVIFEKFDFIAQQNRKNSTNNKSVSNKNKKKKVKQQSKSQSEKCTSDKSKPSDNQPMIMGKITIPKNTKSKE